MVNCYACKAEIVFDSEHVGRNGKKIPLDPESRTPHDCPMREKSFKEPEAVPIPNAIMQEKNDHGKEIEHDGDTYHINRQPEYVDHTLKGQSKVKIFYAGDTGSLEEQYNEFLATNKVKTQGAQFQLDGDAFAIALYYEEVKA